MAKITINTGTIKEDKNAMYVVEFDGKDVAVTKSLNSPNLVIGEKIRFAEMRSLVTLNYKYGSTAWKDAKAIGHKFFKQV